MKNLYLLNILFVASSLSGLSAQTSFLSNDAKALLDYQMKDRVVPAVVADENLTVNEIYRSPIDGCFFGIGDSRNTYDPAGIDCEECLEAGGRAKINGSYVWGLTQSNKKIYWGTINNMLCQAGLMSGDLTTNPLLNPYETACWVCENEKGINGDILGKAGDMLPPRVFVYDPAEGVVKDITPETAESKTCAGFRSAGSFNGVVFFGGPDLVHGLTLFAYAAADDRFLGASHLESVSSDDNFKITNIRKWMVIEGVLYCGIKYQRADEEGGAILRWNGNVNNPYDFEIVGYTEGEAAELEYHDGRIYIGGWPAGNKPAGVYRSPLIPAGGFTAADVSL